MGQFIYLLNAMENAGNCPDPSKEGYGAKRKEVLAYVAKIEDELKSINALRAALRTIEDTARRANQGLLP